MANPVMARDIGKQIAEAMGLDPSKVRDITIRLFPNELAHVYVTMTPTQDEAGAIVGALKHYTLHDEDPNARAESADAEG